MTYEELLEENKRTLADLIHEELNFAKELNPGEQRKDIIAEMKLNTTILNELLNAEKADKQAKLEEDKLVQENKRLHQETLRLELERTKEKHAHIQSIIGTGVKIAGGVAAGGLLVWALSAVMKFEETGSLCSKAASVVLKGVGTLTRFI